MSQSVAVLGSNQIPLTYIVPVPGTLTPLAASATFDGTASAAFIPCLTFYDSDGNLIARAIAPEIAAGASAEVSWFRGLAVGSAVSTVGEVVYLTTPGSGHWTAPDKVAFVTVVCCGAGGGGNGTGYESTGGNAAGGGGGGGGGVSIETISPVGGEMIPYTVGSHGSGAMGNSVLGGSGAGPGGNGQGSSFGTQTAGGGGGGGNTNVGNGGGGGSSFNTAPGEPGGIPTIAAGGLAVGGQSVSGTSVAGAASGTAEYGGGPGGQGGSGGAAGTGGGVAGGNSYYGAGGGGAGGGVGSSAPHVGKGGSGGLTQKYATTDVVGGSMDNPGSFTGPYAGTGGDGGASVSGGAGTTGKNGQKGGQGGGGGGGGGMALVSAGTGTGGNGADGGDGIIILYVTSTS